MSVAVNILVGAFMLASMDTVMSAIVRRDVSSKAQCAAYSYCEGKSFGGRVRVDGRYVTCDTVPEPRKRCCLPNSQHLVCYDIKVDGKLLNYDPSSFSRTTIAYNLCTALLKAHNHTDQGAHIGMLAGDGGGYLTYGHQGWTDLQTPSSRHVHDIACSYGQPAARRTKARHDYQHGRA